MNDPTVTGCVLWALNVSHASQDYNFKFPTQHQTNKQKIKGVELLLRKKFWIHEFDLAWRRPIIKVDLVSFVAKYMNHNKWFLFSSMVAMAIEKTCMVESLMVAEEKKGCEGGRGFWR